MYTLKELYKGDQHFTDVQTDAGDNRELAQVFQWSSMKAKTGMEVPISWLTL